MYNINWIILKKTQIKHPKSLLHIFTKEFGKITGWLTESKTKNPIDIGNIYNFWIKVSGNINKIDSYKWKKIFNLTGLSFKQINSILELISILAKVLPEWMIFESIFDDYYDNFEQFENTNLNEKITSLTTLRLLKKLWITKNPDENHSVNFKKIYSIINSYQFQKILEIKWITSENIEEIRKYNQETLQRYLYWNV